LLTVSGTSSAFNLRFIVGAVRCNPFGAPYEFELEKFGFCKGGEVAGIAAIPAAFYSSRGGTTSGEYLISTSLPPSWL
jgi:hypothetical protein